MKKIILSVLVFSGFAFGQNLAIANDVDAITTIEQPDPVAKTFHKLDAEYEFKLFTHEGELLLEGTSNKVETTGLKPGAYFVSYNGKTERIIIPGVAGS
ncbi:MAG: hypothetical protein GQ574_12855 [Crocinitomix sp.]|nr:hypothetical protein [Crocinitomix sp.]